VKIMGGENVRRQKVQGVLEGAQQQPRFPGFFSKEGVLGPQSRHIERPNGAHHTGAKKRGELFLKQFQSVSMGLVHGLDGLLGGGTQQNGEGGQARSTGQGIGRIGMAMEEGFFGPFIQKSFVNVGRGDGEGQG
jgi:hypothetical protein